MIQNISAVIMAGGKSSRMGKDKALLEFMNSQSMSEYQYKRLRSIFDKVYISSKIDKFDFLEDNSLLILDNDDLFSPMVALNTIFDNITEEKIFLITVDMPLVSIESIQQIIETAYHSSHEIIIAKDTQNNRHSLCGVFNRSIHSNIKEAIAKNIHKINYLINKCDFLEISFEDDDQFININNQEEYKKAIEINQK